jgi:hypothetical protein
MITRPERRRKHYRQGSSHWWLQDQFAAPCTAGREREKARRQSSGLRIGAMIEQHLNHARITRGRRLGKWRHWKKQARRFNRRVGAALQEQFDHRGVIYPARGDKQRCSP